MEERKIKKIINKRAHQMRPVISKGFGSGGRTKPAETSMCQTVQEAQDD